MEHTRAAVTEDAAAIAELMTMLAAELQPTRGGDLWFRRERREPFGIERCLALIARTDAHVAVGTVDGVVVGFGVVELEVLRDATTLGRVTELFVDPGARAVGVGEVLMEALLGFCSEHGCGGVDARVLPGHRAAKNFFEGSGFTARAIVMHRTLEP